MKPLLLAVLLSASAFAKDKYRFDNASLTQIEIDKKHCVHYDGNAGGCTEALVTFMRMEISSKPVSDKPVWLVFRDQRTGEWMGSVLYYPAKCSPLPFDRRGRYLCKDVSWRLP